MRKSLLLFVLLGCLNTNAQIQRRLYEQRLGESTLNNLFQTAQNRGLTVNRVTDASFEIDNVTFANYNWDNARFKYYNNKLQSVLFIKTVDNRIKIEKDALFEIFKHLDESLYNKYSNYLTKREDEYFPFVLYNDGKTIVKIMLTEMKDIKIDELWLEYIDEELIELENQGSDDL